MKRALLGMVIFLGLGVTACKDSRVDDLEKRVAALETAHTATRDKLQALLVWVNRRQSPSVGVYDWMGQVHSKLWPGGPGDPVKPADPPPPF